jgi:hypothetical protein
LKEPFDEIRQPRDYTFSQWRNREAFQGVKESFARRYEASFERMEALGSAQRRSLRTSVSHTTFSVKNQEDMARKYTAVFTRARPGLPAGSHFPELALNRDVDDRGHRQR